MRQRPPRSASAPRARLPPAHAHFVVRAIVARVSGETHLAPAGAFAESDEGVTKDTNFVVNPAELESVEAWQHAKAVVLPHGCTTYADLGEDPSEEAVAKQQAQKEAFPEAPALRAPEEGTFTARVLGDTSTYQFGDVTKTYSAVAIKSTLWPGATAVAGEAGFVNIYIGNGIKKGTELFSPSGMPPALQGSPVDQEWYNHQFCSHIQSIFTLPKLKHARKSCFSLKIVKKIPTRLWMRAMESRRKAKRNKGVKKKII